MFFGLQVIFCSFAAGWYFLAHFVQSISMEKKAETCPFLLFPHSSTCRGTSWRISSVIHPKPVHLTEMLLLKAIFSSLSKPLSIFFKFYFTTKRAQTMKIQSSAFNDRLVFISSISFFILISSQKCSIMFWHVPPCSEVLI